MTTTDDGVRYEVVDRIARVTLDRPHRHNALDAAARQRLRSYVEAFDSDDEVRVLIVAAAGDTSFCAGADLREMAATEQAPSVFSDCLEPLLTTAKPTIAAVNGGAFGGGFLLAQACDLCVAADRATFAITEARWGRGAPWAVPLFELVPRRIALELLLTGAAMSAQRAHEVGLVNAVVPAAELAARAWALAESIRDNAPLTVRGHKAMSRLSTPGLAKATAEAWLLFQPIYASEDAREGPQAFLEKRPPVWRGR